MEEVTARNKLLQKEVDKLESLLQLSERKRSNQKVLYDKNLENLHEQLADFESLLLKERKEIQIILQKKEQQIKVREDLTRALQSKLDSQYCHQCGYPTSKNKFDTDWEIDVSEEDNKEVRKLPPLSLPLPEILPNVSFSNRLTHSHPKSKLSPVAEESEVASSSYLRNIHADQNPDRFHAVLTASLECLQVDHVKKNITPESEYPEEVIGTPSSSESNGGSSSHGNKLNPRKLDLAESLGEDPELPRSQTCRPSIFIESCSIDDDGEVKMSDVADQGMVDYANDLAFSILEIILKGNRRDKLKKQSSVTKNNTPQSTVTNNSVPQSSLTKSNVPKSSVKKINAPNRCIQTFSDNLAFGILSKMGTGVSSSQKSTNRACTGDNDSSFELIGSDSSPSINGNVCKEERTFTFEYHKVEELLSKDNDTKETNPCATSETRNGHEPDYSRLSCIVVPLVDQAFTNAKTIVRRRSSTSALAIDSDVIGDVRDRIPGIGEDTDDSDTNNLSFNRRTLIELIDQAVEQVIPTCSKENDNKNVATSSTMNGLPGDTNGLPDDRTHPNQNGVEHLNGVEDDSTLDGETMSSTITPDNETLENKENEVTKSKKKKSKKKKKKKKSDASNRLPESVDQVEASSLDTNENGIPVIKDCNLDFSFDPSDVVTSSLNNSVTDIDVNNFEPDEDKFSLAVDMSFSEMEASRGSTPDTLDGFQ